MNTPALKSAKVYKPEDPETLRITGQPAEDFEISQSIVVCEWADGVSGWYVESSLGGMVATVSNESEEFTDENECREWLYQRVKRL